MKTEKECYNCKKKGHIKRDCWAKGGGKEGQVPKGRGGGSKDNKSNQAVDLNTAVNVAYMASANLGS